MVFNDEVSLLTTNVSTGDIPSVLTQSGATLGSTGISGKSGINYENILAEALSNIMAAQMKSNFSISDYNKQLEEALKLLKQRQLSPSNNFEVTLKNSLRTVNRRSPVKLTNEELDEFATIVTELGNSYM